MTATRNYQLNSKQVHILKMLYKFRFISGVLLGNYRGDYDQAAANKALNTLVRKGYVDKLYDSSYKLLGKAARYSLAAKSLTYLRDEHGVSEKALHVMYKNKTVSQAFIDHSLDIVSVYLAIRHRYPGIFHIFTRSELADFDYFPNPKPDMYLNRIKHSGSKTNEYIIDILDNPLFFVSKKRLQALVDHFDEGEWEAETENSYPTILLICKDQKLEQKLLDHANKVLDAMGIDEEELTIFTTTLKVMQTSSPGNLAIWTSVYDSTKRIRI